MAEPMTDCPLTLNNDGHWQCPECGWVYPRPADRPPRRNCPKGTGRPAPPTPRETVLARYDAAPNPLPIAREEVERRLTICEACPHFASLSCITVGSSCKRPAYWQQRVLLLDCENWPHLQPAPAVPIMQASYSLPGGSTDGRQGIAEEA